MHCVIRIAFAIALMGIAGMSMAAARDGAHGHSPQALGRSVTSLDVYALGDTIDLLTGESEGRQTPTTLWHRRSNDGGRSWSSPSRVDAGFPAPRYPHRGNDAQIASDPRHIVAAWTTAGRGWLGTGPLITAFSPDGGKTWRRGGSPAFDERSDGQSYADLSARGGRFHLAWLDSRGAIQGVRYAMSADGGTSWKSNTSIRSASCECCWNALLPAANRSIYLLYRDKAPRDMGMAISHDDGASWKNAGVVGAFNWRIDACPHTGGALATTGDAASQRLHALVWTGKADARGLHLFTGGVTGADWNEGARIGGEYAQRGDLAARGQTLVAVWDEVVGERSAVFYTRSANGGESWSTPSRLSSEEVAAVYPRVVAARSNLLVVWTEAAKDAPSALRMVLLK